MRQHGKFENFRCPGGPETHCTSKFCDFLNSIFLNFFTFFQCLRFLNHNFCNFLMFWSFWDLRNSISINFEIYQNLHFFHIHYQILLTLRSGKGALLWPSNIHNLRLPVCQVRDLYFFEVWKLVRTYLNCQSFKNYSNFALQVIDFCDPTRAEKSPSELSYS